MSRSARWLPKAYDPAVDAEHFFSVDEADVMINGVTPQSGAEKAFKRVEEIFAKYPIAES
jgi:hypothetical protein